MTKACGVLLEELLHKVRDDGALRDVGLNPGNQPCAVDAPEKRSLLENVGKFILETYSLQRR